MTTAESYTFHFVPVTPSTPLGGIEAINTRGERVALFRTQAEADWALNAVRESRKRGGQPTSAQRGTYAGSNCAICTIPLSPATVDAHVRRHAEQLARVVRIEQP